MKLRNKKTGEIYNWASIEIKDSKERIKLSYQKDEDWRFKCGSELNFCYYEDFKGLLSEFEIYKPKEPLIKDEKIRKAVRAWAETIKAKSAFIEKPHYERADLILSDGFATISFPIDKPKELNFCKRYTIEELCGEE